MDLQGFSVKSVVSFLTIGTIGFCVLAYYGFLQPVPEECIKEGVDEPFIPIINSSEMTKYGLHFYGNEEHLKRLTGVPVLFIPGNRGSYKQVRFLAAESSRAYQNGPLEHTFYREASLAATNSSAFQLHNMYSSRLDWFAVDLGEEFSAVDRGVLEENTEYVVYAIQKILDLYDARAREGAMVSGHRPKSVILVGHSMGGFVARAAVIHPRLRKSAVETVLTLSTPHQSPPLALQPSLVHYYTRVNQEWRDGYKIQTTNTGRIISDPVLSHVVLISISGSYNDYQIRTKETALDDIVPETHGFMISSSAMKNVWLSVDHNTIIQCNQLVVQVSHTLLSLTDFRTGQPFPDAQKRLSVFARMLRSGISHDFNRMIKPASSRKSISIPVQYSKDATGSLEQHESAACPSNIHWTDEGLESDLDIHTNVVTVLAMDGRRRWMDMQKLGSNGKSHFIFVTNLEPCSGVRLHLWPEKDKYSSSLPVSGGVVEVTTKMMRIPSGQAPRQIETGRQTEQTTPSAVFWLGPKDMNGFRFLTISIAPHQTVSGRSPSQVSMAVGQFFNPEEAKQEFSPWFIFQSIFSPKEMLFKETHPLAINLSFAVSLGLLPVTLSLKIDRCRIRSSAFPEEEDVDLESSSHCKLRCFRPVALAWDDTSGLHIYPNLYSDTILVDSSPAFWSSTQQSQKTIVLLLVDPQCSYKSSIAISVSAAARRYLLLYNPMIVGFSFAIILFALMWQAMDSNSNQSMPPMLTAMESNLTVKSYLILQATVALFIFFHSLWTSQSFPPSSSFISISLVSYMLANGFIAILISLTHLVFCCLVAVARIFIKTRKADSDPGPQTPTLSQADPSRRGNDILERHVSFSFLNRVFTILRTNAILATAILAGVVHSALGPLILVCFHFFCCLKALWSIMTDSHGNSAEEQETLNIYRRHLVLFILDLAAAMMFAPSFVAKLVGGGMVKSFPSLLDSIVSVGIILHGACNLKPRFSSLALNNLWIWFLFFGGCGSYLCGLALAPHRTLYVLATVGGILLSLKIKVNYDSPRKPHTD